MVTTKTSSNNPSPPLNTSRNSPPLPIPPPPSNTNHQPPIQPPPDILHDLIAAIRALSARVSAVSIHPQQPLNIDDNPESSHRGTTRVCTTSYARGRPRGWHAQDEEDNSRSFQFPRQLHTKIDFPRFERGDPRGWVLKAEKYFRYFQISNEMKVEVTARHIEGDTLDLYAWINGEDEILLWEDLIKAFQGNYGPP
ncbi:hypothetical protein LIER_14309 [Lithospermum erythrorhizon]|uniref:Uncharacterized protein n=1 Tax=Lithospermum erythrorhizon TaxID=34254 RepID=A0AAV3Q2W0_LITER